MTKFSLDDLDRHIENLRTQLQFLNEGLDATDHNAPDWLATDLLSLRNKSGRLQDDMKRFRDQLESEGLVTKKAKNANKRLSIEGVQLPDPPEPSTKKARLSIPGPAESTEVRPADEDPTPQTNPAQVGSTYVVQHIDVTEEVNRRLQESRLRRLMETPSTAQKRKRDDDEDTRMESGTETEVTPRTGYDGNDDDPTPTKRLRTSGTFERVGKRTLDGNEGQNGTGNSYKRRKYSWKSS
ncbi:hypothetical protein BU25DRAFT_457787 [Macroventuria anomochaeta]|uniref:Uncharacterized protein n=1 Tax=Macroventuria anomochaeta TaxID=301207 RepID=A0ACB6S362_9PLEO|nr:uncharacterized protein BU25DRAFT_457787 [Macroventuria anomochaeta]KAF2628473.1 hypothetical protein BU25DRAFT_457787 [Macroventuria anomochaeta]